MKKKNNIILDLCGGTGSWSKPYKDNGYDVRNITLPDYDVRLYIPPENVYGILAAPPCTHLCQGGAHLWAKKDKEHPELLFEALAVVDACLRIIIISKPHFWVLENPVYHKHGSFNIIKNNPESRSITPPGFAKAFYEANK